MSTWLPVLVGVLAGLIVVAGAIFVAVRPNLGPRIAKSSFPDTSDNKDNIAGWTGWSGWLVEGDHGSTGDGACDGGFSGDGSAH